MLPAQTVTAVSTSPTLDRAVLDSLRHYDPDGQQGLIADLVATFEVEARDRLIKLRAALTAGDSKLAGRLAHNLRGLACAIGATLLADLSQELEYAVASGRDMRRWNLDPIEREYHRVARALITST